MQREPVLKKSARVCVGYSRDEVSLTASGAEYLYTWYVPSVSLGRRCQRLAASNLTPLESVQCSNASNDPLQRHEGIVCRAAQALIALRLILE